MWKEWMVQIGYCGIIMTIWFGCCSMQKLRVESLRPGGPPPFRLTLIGLPPIGLNPFGLGLPPIGLLPFGLPSFGLREVIKKKL